MEFISQKDLKAFEDQPRVLDLKLAVALGFEHPRSVRVLVKRHRDELKRYGEVCITLAQTSPKGGRPAPEHWLNEQQAVLLCMFARTERAADVRQQIVRAFLAWRAERSHVQSASDELELGDDVLDAYQAKLTMLRECRLIFGRASAKNLWGRLGMPAVEIAGASYSSGGGKDDVGAALGDFLATCTATDPAARIQSSVLYAAFTEWCQSYQVKTICSQKSFTMAMARRGFERYQSNVVFWIGIRLIPKIAASG